MRRWHILLAAGLIGVASLLLVPLEALAPTRLPWFALRALATLQPAVLTALAVALGEATAPRVGLHAPLVEAWVAGGDVRAVLRRQLGPALIVAVVVAAILLLYGATIGRELLAGAGAQARLASFDLPLPTRLLYGGITEELLTRWALVSLFAWIGWRLAGRPAVAGTGVMAAAVTLAALLFAAGHLPLLFLIAPAAGPGVIAAVLVANALPGVLFGWLYVRRGLEAAMLAHAAAHLLGAVAAAVV